MGVDTDAIIPTNSKLKAEVFVLENEASERLSSLLSVSSDIITRHVCEQADVVVMGMKHR